MVVPQNLVTLLVNGLRQRPEKIHHKMCGHGGESMVKVWFLDDKG